MSDNFNAVEALNAAATTEAAVPVVKTKEEKLAAIKAKIEKLEQQYDDVLNDRAVTKAAAKPTYCPEVGDKVIATIGRNTATSQAKLVEGVVTAVKHPAIVDGKASGAIQVRVRVYEGTFEEQLVTLYPAQLTPIPVSDAPVDSAE